MTMVRKPGYRAVTEARNILVWALGLCGPTTLVVMPGLVPGISLNLIGRKSGEHVDGRNKSGHDAVGTPCKRMGTSRTGYYAAGRAGSENARPAVGSLLGHFHEAEAEAETVEPEGLGRVVQRRHLDPVGRREDR